MINDNTEEYDLGSSPWGEPCAQVGEYDYGIRGPAECKLYRELIRRVFGMEPQGSRLIIKSNPHDFGNYYTIALKFKVDNERAWEYANNVDNNLPEKWDDQAKRELAKS